MSDDNRDWLAGIFITAIVFLALGYAWGWYHGEMKFERGYQAAIEEMDVMSKGELCQ